MATLEQREAQPAGLSTLSNNLDLYNDFKDDKDSDEESFHLPMLDCDDDIDSNNKEVSNGTDKDDQCHSCETEDDILNRFETAATPDIDPKIEDKLLNDFDEIYEKNSNETNVESNKSDHIPSQDLQHEKNTTDEVSEEKNHSESLAKKELDKEITNSCLDLPIEEEPLEKVQNDTEVKLEMCKDSSLFEGTETEKKEIENSETITEKSDKDEETCQTENQIESVNVPENVTASEVTTDKPKDGDNKQDMKEIKEHENENIEKYNVVDACKDLEKNSELSKIVENEHVSTNDIGNQRLSEVTKDETAQPEKDITLDTEEKTQDTQLEKKEMEIEESVRKDIEECTYSVEITPNESMENVKDNENTDEKMDVEKGNDISTTADKVSKTAENNSNVENDVEKISGDKVDTLALPLPPSDIGKSTHSQNILEGDSAGSSKKESEILEDSTSVCKPTKEKDSVHSKPESVGLDKCENSNDFNKNLECDDLLDISIIRDADEDNASAIAENTNDGHSSEKSDNDDQDEGSEKTENELDESEMDQEETSLANDKDDGMDVDDGNSSNLAYRENTVSESTSDSETKDDLKDSGNDSNMSSVLKEKTNSSSDNVIYSEKNQTDELRTELENTDSESMVADDQDSLKENSLKLGGKRLLQEADTNADSINKKIKLSDTAIVNEKKKIKKIKTLLSFDKFMQNKKFENKLSRSDLEQFCLQKICETIVHKTEVGELHQTIKKQELIIDNLRKDLQQLTKQTRDLDIVNKKLMNELRAQNGIKKPLVPLKITRSVGLQVKLNVGVDNNCRRKTPISVGNRTPSTPNHSRQRTITPGNANVVRQVATSPRKAPTTATPLLSQALQNARQPNTVNTTKRPPIRPKPAEPQKPANPGVIDLTDEDDRASKAAGGTPVKIINKTIPLTQAKTLNIVQNKAVATKAMNNNQSKTVAIGQVKATAVGGKLGTPTRTVSALPQGVRLTPTQVKNGSITIPASVVTSSSGTPQLMYVVQPTSSLGQVVTTSPGGAQKAVLLNFQSTNGVLTSTLNGSAVSVIPTKTTNTVQLKPIPAPRKHPAPLPSPPPIAVNGSLKPLLPKPHLSIRKTDTGIILQWRMPYNLDIYEGIASYQLFAYQETNAAPSTDMWRKVGDVKALALPMACTLTQFADKNKYYFAVRSVDVHKRIGAFSDPEEISL